MDEVIDLLYALKNRDSLRVTGLTYFFAGSKWLIYLDDSLLTNKSINFGYSFLRFDHSLSINKSIIGDFLVFNGYSLADNHYAKQGVNYPFVSLDDKFSILVKRNSCKPSDISELINLFNTLSK